MPVSVAHDYLRTARTMMNQAEGDLADGNYQRAIRELLIAQSDIQSAIEHATRAQLAQLQVAGESA